MSTSTRTDSQFAYGGEVIRCHGCATQHKVTEKFSKDGGDQAGIMVRMTKYPGE